VKSVRSSALTMPTSTLEELPMPLPPKVPETKPQAVGTPSIFRLPPMALGMRMTRMRRAPAKNLNSCSKWKLSPSGSSKSCWMLSNSSLNLKVFSLAARS
jgi:hypothetical protein